MQIVAWFLYLFTLIATFFMVGVLPLVLLWQAVELLRTRKNARWILVTLLIIAGFLAGGAIGWSLRPFEWHMPVWETFYAGVHSDIYGHELESKAERVALYLLFTADLGAVAAGVATIATRRFRRPA